MMKRSLQWFQQMIREKAIFRYIQRETTQKIVSSKGLLHVSIIHAHRHLPSYLCTLNKRSMV